VPRPGRREVQRRLAVGESAYHARAPSDLSQDALERIVFPLGRQLIGRRISNRSNTGRYHHAKPALAFGLCRQPL